MLNPKPDIKRQERELEELLDKLDFNASDTELTSEKKRQRRKRAAEGPVGFAKTYFPQVFTKPFSDLHRHMAQLEEGKYSVSGFPEAGKSAFAFLGILVRHIALGKGGVTVIAARTDDKAKAHTKLIRRVIEKSEALRYDFDLSVVQDVAGDYIFKSSAGSGGNAGHTRLVAGSVNVGVRGTVSDEFDRITLAIGDDLYDRESSRSETDNKRVYKWITGELHRQMEDDGLCIILGNAIVEDCPILQLKKRFPDRHYSFPIMRSAETGGQDVPTWPEGGYTKEKIAEMEAETDFDVWQGEYMESPAELGDVFDTDWLRTVRLSLTEIIASIAAVDPAHGESPAACRKGCFCLGVTEKREVVALDVWLRKDAYSHLFDHLNVLRQDMPRFKAILFENDFSQWNFAKPYYKQWTEKRGVTLPIIMHRSSQLKTEHRGADKESRIMNLVHPHQTGGFLYHSRMTSGADWDRYKKEFLAFGNSKEKLDGLDAAATAYILIFRYITTGTFKALKKRKMQAPKWAGGFH